MIWLISPAHQRASSAQFRAVVRMGVAGVAVVTAGAAGGAVVTIGAVGIVTRAGIVVAAGIAAGAAIAGAEGIAVAAWIAVGATAARAVGAPASSRITTVLLSTQTTAIAAQAMVIERVRDELPGVSVKAYSCAAIQALRIQCIPGQPPPSVP